MEILQYPDKRLKRRSKKVQFPLTRRELLLLWDMREVGRDKGVAIAAPQLGIPLRVISFYHEGLPPVMFNPVILEVSSEMEVAQEGCLSIENGTKLFEVPRATNVWVNYRDITDNPLTFEFNGMQARIIQHEVDHLDGKLINEYPAVPEPDTPIKG